MTAPVVNAENSGIGELSHYEVVDKPMVADLYDTDHLRSTSRRRTKSTKLIN
jgi:hypothetical protein